MHFIKDEKGNLLFSSLVCRKYTKNNNPKIV